MTPRTIEIQLDELVLEGVPLDPRAGAALRAAVETHLARLVAAHGWPETPPASPRPVTLAPLAPGVAGDAERLGGAVARGVLDALHGGPAAGRGRRS